MSLFSWFFNLVLYLYARTKSQVHILSIVEVKLRVGPRITHVRVRPLICIFATVSGYIMIKSLSSFAFCFHSNLK